MESHGDVGPAMEAVGYAPSVARTPAVLTKSNGWQELMRRHLPDSALAKRHRELLEKQEQISHLEKDINTGQIKTTFIDVPDTQAVSKALDMAYKLKGAYAPEKSVNVNIDTEPSDRVKDLAKKLNDAFYEKGQ